MKPPVLEMRFTGNIDEEPVIYSLWDKTNNCCLSIWAVADVEDFAAMEEDMSAMGFNLPGKEG